MSSKPILTVAIPTYNRVESLTQVIDRLSKEKGEFFTILVSDNNSTDSTEHVIKQYQKRISNLIYHKNITNLGYSGNVCKLYELAKTRYIWFLCDDDNIVPGAVSNIIRSLKKYQPVVAFFNCTWINSCGQKGVAGVTDDILHTDINKLTNYQILIRSIFLSIIVIEKRVSIKKLKNKNYRDNIFFQLTLVLMTLSDKFRLAEIATTIVNRNVGYKYGEFFKCCVADFIKAIYIIPHKFDNNRFIKISRSHILQSLQLYLSQKLGLFCYNGKITVKTKKVIFRYYGQIIGSIYMLFPFIKQLIPTSLVKSIYLLRLVMMHRLKNGLVIYKNNINRAFKDDRQSGFLEDK